MLKVSRNVCCVVNLDRTDGNDGAVRNYFHTACHDIVVSAASSPVINPESFTAHQIF